MVLHKHFFYASVAVILLLSSCGLPEYSYRQHDPSPSREKIPLYRVDITSFWSHRYTGLLGVSLIENELRYVLLDTMGITLLSATINAHGNTIKQQGIKNLTESSLPKALATSLSRIYLIEPMTLPCSQFLWLTFCQKKVDDDSRIKYSRNGPFTSWQVLFDAQNQTITYSQPWVGFVLTLTNVSTHY